MYSLFRVLVSIVIFTIIIIDSEIAIVDDQSCLSGEDCIANETVEKRRYALDSSNYRYPYACPGLEYGWTCNYESPMSSRDGDHFFCDIDIIPYDTPYVMFHTCIACNE